MIQDHLFQKGVSCSEKQTTKLDLGERILPHFLFIFKATISEKAAVN